MRYDVLLIAGTTEAREVLDVLMTERKNVLACVTTDLGADMLSEYPITVHIGKLDLEGFMDLLEENPCDKIIDASHPFARIVTRTVKEAGSRLGIPYERYERKALSYDYEDLHMAADAAQAVELLNQIEGPVLLTTGVNTAKDYMQGVKEGKDRLYIRVLDNESSYRGCREAGYPEDHVFGEMPPFSIEDNLRLIRRTGAAVMVSKDSGKTGGVDIKVEACRQAGIPMILIARPS